MTLFEKRFFVLSSLLLLIAVIEVTCNHQQQHRVISL
jgi:hypothetical protein